jgi:hypothetical protein
LEAGVVEVMMCGADGMVSLEVVAVEGVVMVEKTEMVRVVLFGTAK